MAGLINMNWELAKKAAAEELWLHYFNRTLFEAGVITEAERNRMSNRIDGRRNGYKNHRS